MMVKAWQIIFVAGLAAGVQGVAADDDASKFKWVKLHGWLMWASLGFLAPLGVILIRYSRSQTDPTATVSPARLRTFFFLHVTVQFVGVILAIAGISVLLNTMGNEFSHTHQKLGLALFIIVVIMPFIGIFGRSMKGTLSRSYWFFVHWLFGTGVVVLGIVNCFIGIYLYQRYTASISSLNIAFSIQVAVMGLAYFLQDKWNYILGQGSQQNSKLTTKTLNGDVGDTNL